MGITTRCLHSEHTRYDGDHLALRFEDGNLAGRYMYGPAIDQILAVGEGKRVKGEG